MKKIMFNDKYSLTQAVLSGEKIQTRRIVPDNFFTHQWDEVARNVLEVYDWEEGDWLNILDTSWKRYKVGETVAIAQSYKDADCYPGDDDGIGALWSRPGWNNKMFVKAELMPHQIRITDVRIEKLQDISDEDCINEGVGKSRTENVIGYPLGIPFNYYIGEDKKGSRYTTPREAFAVLIDKISGKGTWESNPYVFVYEFELVK